MKKSLKEKMTSHLQSVETALILPGTPFLASGSRDGGILLWNRHSREVVHHLRGHSEAIVQLAYLRRLKRLVSASADMTVRLWDIRKGQQLDTLRGHYSPLTCLSVSKSNTILSADQGGLMKLWNGEGKELTTLGGHGAAVRQCQFLDEIGWVDSAIHAISCSDDGTIRAWDLEKGVQVDSISCRCGKVYGFNITSDVPNIVMSYGEDGAARVWRWDKSRDVVRLGEDHGSIKQIVTTADGHNQYASITEKGYIECWGKDDILNSTPTTAITACCIADYSDFMAYVSGKQICVIEDQQLSSKTMFEDFHGNLVDCVMSSGDTPIVLSEFGGISYWSNGVFIDHVNISHKDLRCTCMAQINKTGRLVIGSESGEILLIEDSRQVGTDVRAATATAPQSSPVRCLLVTEDENEIIVGYGDAKIRIWDSFSLELLAEIKIHGAAINHIAELPNFRLFASASDDNSVILWSRASALATRTIVGHSAQVTGVAEHSDQRSIVTTSKDKSVRVWDIESGQLLQTLYGEFAYTCIANNNNGSVVIGDEGGNLWVYQISNFSQGEEASLDQGHVAPV